MLESKFQSELIKELEKDYPMLRQKIIGAMQTGNISEWGTGEND